ncbi:MAG: replicative DNA helicase [Planctomycetes bacterium]|jgi:replicative DNA helicase|nr:replicative DNA helicase [Planctomycetota bacterium]
MTDADHPERVAPHNEDAEQSIVGALLLAPDRIPEVSEALQPEDFYSKRHRAVFESLMRLADRNADVTFVTVGEDLRAAETFQMVGGTEALIDLANRMVSAAHLAHHVRIVAELSELRRLIESSTEIIEEAYQTRPDGESVKKLLDDAEHRIFQISRARGNAGADPIREVLSETFKRIDSSSHRADVTGLNTGFYELNDKLCGLNAGDLIIIAARPSMGKTAFALNMIEHAALTRPGFLDVDPTVLLFSLEMGKHQIVSRMLCSRARVDAHKLRTGRLPAEDYTDLTVAADDLQKGKIFIDDSPNLSVMALRGRARRMKAKHGLHLIVVDYLQLMTHPKAESRQMEISAISRSLKALARELEVPVIALAQLSRAVESREPPRPMLSDLRESGSIEQDADVVMLLYRAEYYPKFATDENKGKAEVIIAKHRNGPTGTVTLNFFPQHMRFENPELSIAEPVFA